MRPSHGASGHGAWHTEVRARGGLKGEGEEEEGVWVGGQGVGEGVWGGLLLKTFK